jgi:transketolase
VEAAALLAVDGIGARVVSMPSWDRFAAQDDTYRESVLPTGIPKLAVEAGATHGWERYVDAVIGIDHFGTSAPGPTVLAEFGFTAENVAARARTLIAGAH